MSIFKNNFRIISWLLFGILFQVNTSAQNKSNSFSWNNNKSDDSIFMTWDKNTPESEMKDDIKALAAKGVTINYSNVKRNSNNEIIAIKVTFADRKGNEGTMEYKNQKPINTIHFYQNNDGIGFGTPDNGDIMLTANDFLNNFSNGNGNSKNFGFNFNYDDLKGNNDQTMPYQKSYREENSKIVIKKEGKKPLVIENGEVTEGGDDYTKEELDEIKKNNQVESFGFDSESDDLNGDNFQNQMQRMQEEMKKMMPQLQQFNQQMEANPNPFGIKTPPPSSSNEDLNKTKEDMLKAKDEMIKAKEEMEKAKKELEKAKSSLNIKKV